MIPEWPYKHLVPGDFPVYAGRREDEADIEPLWQPLYDCEHAPEHVSTRRYPQGDGQIRQERLNGNGT